MGSRVSKRSSIPITVSHPRLDCYYNEYNDKTCISTVAMALNDSSTNLHNQSSQQQQQARPKMSVKSSQTSPMNRSSHNLSTTGTGSKGSPPTGVYSVAKQHQSLQVKPRMGRSSLALDDNSNFLLGSTHNLRKVSMDSGSSQNSDDLNNNPRRLSPLEKEVISYTPPADEFIKLPTKLDDHYDSDENNNLNDNDDDDDDDDETNDNHANASKLIVNSKNKSSKNKSTKDNNNKKNKSNNKKKLKGTKELLKSSSAEKRHAKEKKRREAETEKKNMKKRSSRDVECGKSSSRSRGRTSSCISVVFFFELCSIIGLGLFAALLRFTATFDIVPRTFRCDDPSLSLQDSLDYAKNATKIFFFNVPELWIHGACLTIPLALIFVLEFFRGIIGFLLERPNYEAKVRTLGIPIAPGVRRFYRFIGGYLIGFFVLSILCDALKHQTGILRPTFLSTCPKLAEFCATKNATETFTTTDVSSLCFEIQFRYSQTRFPSSTSAFATYAAGFSLLYLCIALPHRGLRFVRIWAVLALLLSYLFVMNVQLQSIHSLPIDSFTGAGLAILILVLVVFFHLNAFATKISDSNFFPSNRVSVSVGDRLSAAESGQSRRLCGTGNRHSLAGSCTSDAELELDDLSHVSSAGLDRDREWFWKSFHIPRVHTLRQSARALWRKTGYRPGIGGQSSAGSASGAASPQASTLPARKAAYINPAFSNRDSDYLSAETRFSSGVGSEGFTASAANVRRC